MELREKHRLAITGAVIGAISVLLVVLGNPKNMGFCIACFIRDIAGGMHLHTAPIVEYMRPEIIGIILGSFAISVITGDFRPRSGSSPVLRFVIGFFVMIGALVFLGCPLRMVLRLAGGDMNAFVALLGFIAGIGVGCIFLSNGFSLVRKVFEMTKENLETYREELGTTLGDALLTPTKIYVKTLANIKKAGVTIKGCSHITGGGFYENVPRMLPDGKHAVIKKDSYPVLPIFKLLQKEGNIEEKMMYNTYNMGLGMVLAIAPEDVEKTIAAIEAAGEKAYVVGHIENGEKGVTLL